MKKWSENQIQLRRFGFSLLFPSVVVLIFLTVFPMIFIFLTSFTDFYFLSKDTPNFIGIDNYIDVFGDRYFLQSVFNTLKFMFLAVIFEVLIALFLANLVNSIRYLTKLIRSFILLPYLLPPVTTALIWQMMFSNNEGIVNKIIEIFGFNAQNWLQDPSTALYAILFIDIWQYMPFVFLILYTAILNAPKEQYEAAKLDGASEWQQFIYVTVPNILPAILMAVVLRMIDTFRLFDKVNILTGGGPANTTATISQYIFQKGIQNLQIGYGSTVSVLMVLVVLLFSFQYITKQLQENSKDN